LLNGRRLVAGWLVWRGDVETHGAKIDQGRCGC
jgi:hypothetical protein